MEVTLWGVRGSIPNSSRDNQFYGANTACVELRPDSGELLIFDAGTGIRSLGRTLGTSGTCHIFLSHGHMDHVQGLCFFQPFFNPDWTVHLYLPEWMEDTPYRLFDGSSFPAPFNALKADIRRHAIRAGERFELHGNPGVRIEALRTLHPGENLAFRVRADKAVFLYTGDHEIQPDSASRDATAAMLKGVTLAVVDATFSRADYVSGWGHSAWEDWNELAERVGLPTLVLSHHEAERPDAELDAVQRSVEAGEGKTRVLVAREGMVLPVTVGPVASSPPSNWFQSFIDGLSRYKEETVLLDRILLKAREVTRADAGTFFLADGDDLVFAYAHNDTLFSAGNARKSIYVNMRLPITLESIAGYTAATGNSLNLPDVYLLPEDVPYGFNVSYDQKSGYRTRSVLTVPMFSRTGQLLGVLQLINSLDPRLGTAVPFTGEMEQTVRLLAREAAVFLEISAQARSNIERLLRIAVLHDPTETGPHAERVGALAAELYQHWAEKCHEEPEIIRYYRGQLRLAAMLHDIGKVGISDLVLKKNGKLTDEEFAVMQQHTRFGAFLFAPGDKDLSELAHEIALHHHQKWDGKGYPLPDDGVPLAGRDVPLSARLTAIADVFDALVSPRSYKKPWTFEEAEAMLHKDAGTHFDPELVQCFSEMMETVRLIYDRFPDHELPPPPDDTGKRD